MRSPTPPTPRRLLTKRPTPPSPYPLGLIFRSARILRDRTLDVQASLIGISAAELSRIERGLVAITPQMSARITEALVAPVPARRDLPEDDLAP